MTAALLDFYLKSNPITLLVLGLLSIYFFIITWTFIYRYFNLSEWISKESSALESLLMGSSVISNNAYLNHFVKTSESINKELFDLGILSATKDATKGLTVLSIIASTSPFIGLFGTVVSILDTFAEIGKSTGGMMIIAAGVSDALVATAAGIFVAIFAYTFHQILKRKAFELTGLVRMQSDTLLSRRAN